MKHLLFGLAACASLVGFLAAPSCTTELGDLPAKCPDGECPDGYDCINGVCALPGTPVPVTVARIGNLRGGDLRMLPQSGSALIVWETYPYSEEGQAVVATRLRADGSVSEQFALENTWKADAGLLEPYFDVVAISDEQAVLAISSSPLAEDPRSRLGIFRVELPAEGSESSASAEPSQRIGEEILMPTIGYGAVSQPRFVRIADDRVQLGYFQSLNTTEPQGQGGAGGSGDGGSGVGGSGGGEGDGETFGQLAVFNLDASGQQATPIAPCDSADETCCRAHACLTARPTLPIAVGVVAGYVHPTGVTWILDETRPSALVVDQSTSSELVLPPLSIPLTADASSVLLLRPSERTGEQLPTDPVEGPAEFGRHAATGVTVLSKLPGVRDTPRPAWVRRDGEPAILVTPGTDASAPELLVYTVDETLGDATEVLRIKRFSKQPVAAVQATVVAGKLYVAWLEQGEEEAVIRAAVSAAP